MINSDSEAEDFLDKIIKEYDNVSCVLDGIEKNSR